MKPLHGTFMHASVDELSFTVHEVLKINCPLEKAFSLSATAR